MQLELLFTVLSFGFTSMVSVNSTLLGFHLLERASIPFGGIFGLFMVVFGMYSTYHMLKSYYFSKAGRAQLTEAISQTVPF